MTEAEWQDCTDPTAMLDYLRGKVSDRKWRLLACACCRRIWHLLTDPRHREAVAVAERLADREVTPEQARAAADASYSATFGQTVYQGFAANLLVRHLSSYDDWDETNRCPPLENTNLAADAVAEPLRQQERAAQAALVRDVFPFRQVVLFPAWLTPTVVSLANSAYDERQLPSGEMDPGRLAILADALEEAGCDNAALLGHLRGPGPHVRGCWMLDLLLGKG
jgi:hypothetical protein